MIIPQERNQLINVFLEKNGQVNLSAIRDPEGVYVKHILDSLELLKIINLSTGELIEDEGLYHNGGRGNAIPLRGPMSPYAGPIKIADIGTGGGFPLLPLATMYPEIQFVGIDSVRKKIQAIGDISNSLKLENIELVRDRIEEIKEKFDIVTARAVAHVSKLLPWTKYLLRSGSKLILYKAKGGRLKAEGDVEVGIQPGSTEKSEEEVLMSMLDDHYLKLIKKHEYSLFEGDIERVIYVLERKKR